MQNGSLSFVQLDVFVKIVHDNTGMALETSIWYLVQDSYSVYSLTDSVVQNSRCSMMAMNACSHPSAPLKLQNVCGSGLTESTAAAQIASAPATSSPACKAGQEAARELLLQGSRLSSTQWQPGNVLTCAAWTFLAACLPDQPCALDQSLQEIDLENLGLVLHGLQRCLAQAPKLPALWPDTLLWWYLLLAAKVTLVLAAPEPLSRHSHLFAEVLVCSSLLKQLPVLQTGSFSITCAMHSFVGFIAPALCWCGVVFSGAL